MHKYLNQGYPVIRFLQVAVAGKANNLGAGK